MVRRRDWETAPFRATFRFVARYTLDLPPGLRQTFKTQVAVRWKSIVRRLASNPNMAVMDDRGLFITSHAIRRQLAAMPNELYLIRLIHRPSRRPFPGERLWTATQLLNTTTVRFLRARNREGCDVYIQQFAGQRNAGYILVDLDRAD